MNILIFTGSRGEWGYLKPILSRLKFFNISFDICVTNMHLLQSKGYTVNEIISDGYIVNHMIPIYGTDECLFATPKAIAGIISSLSNIIYANKYDYILIAGDRFETLAAAIACFYSEIPIAHIQAGEKSGNKDDMARHAIARLSSLHFASNNDAKNRLIKSGEELWRIFVTGAPQLDNISSFKVNHRQRDKNTAIILLHSETLGIDSNIAINDIVCFLLDIKFNIDIILPNTDNGSSTIVDQINNINHKNVNKHRNMKREEYLKKLASCTLLIGNSSSGILEAPSFGTPVINIGSRQLGRIQGCNVVNCRDSQRKNLDDSYNQICSSEFQHSLLDCKNPYGDGNSSDRIIKILTENLSNKHILQKRICI